MDSVLYFLIYRGGATGSKGGEKTQALEQKVFKLQEELTELHRRRGEVGTHTHPSLLSIGHVAYTLSKRDHSVPSPAGVGRE